MENFFTMEYLIAYIGFVVVFVLYLVADNKAKKLQRKCSIMYGCLREVENITKFVRSCETEDDEVRQYRYGFTSLRSIDNFVLDRLKYLDGLGKKRS